MVEILEEIEDYLAGFDEPITYDESTGRKKLKEYSAEGIVQTSKEGRIVYYNRTPNINITSLQDAIDFFSEVAPCGVIGSFLQDNGGLHDNLFCFKHHYMTQALDSDIMAKLFDAIQEGRYVTVDNFGKSLK